MRFKGQFSGHETFPLCAIFGCAKLTMPLGTGAARTIFSAPESIITFGVGKNMALAIRHWALACGIIEEQGGLGLPTLGRSLFGGERPWDPIQERPATAWLVQWQIAGDPKMTTTWFWAFNHLSVQTFDHEALSSSILQYADQGNGRASLKRRSRATSSASFEATSRGLKRPLGRRFGAGFGRAWAYPTVGGPSLRVSAWPEAESSRRRFRLCAECLLGATFADAVTLSVERSPTSRALPAASSSSTKFSMVQRLTAMEEVTRGRIVWSDTAGVRQVLRPKPCNHPACSSGDRLFAGQNLRRAATPSPRSPSPAAFSDRSGWTAIWRRSTRCRDLSVSDPQPTASRHGAL